MNTRDHTVMVCKSPLRKLSTTEQALALLQDETLVSSRRRQFWEHMREPVWALPQGC
jgi:hypothetical protein